MQGLLEFPDNPPLYPSNCDVALGKFEPLIKKEEAKEVIVSCHNPLGQNIITCKHPYRQEFIDEIDGLALNCKLNSGIPELPFYIPVLDLASSKFGSIPSYLPVVGITLNDILAHGGAKQIAGSYHEKNPISFRSDLLSSESFRKKNVIVFLTGTDTLIESVWRKRNECKLFETIQDMGFWAAGGINFSVIGGECAFAQLLNQKRSLYSASLIEQTGIPAIPHVYAINSFHINRWIKWFIANPSVKLFTINCQLQKSDADIEQVIITVKRILRHLPYLHVLLKGFHLDEMYQFGSLLERIHLADKTPVKFAHMRREIFLDSTTGRLQDLRRSTKTKKELMINNITIRYLFLEALRSKILQRVLKHNI